MSLSSIVIKREHIKVGNESFEVRGLSLFDLQVLMTVHMDDILQCVQMYDEFDSQHEDAFEDVGVLSLFLAEISKELPELCCAIIAYAADEQDQVDKVKQFPMGLMVSSMITIGKLTFEEIGGVKKLVEQAIQALSAARVELENQSKSLKSGT